MIQAILTWFREYNTPKRLHARGECRKSLMGYTCHGRNNFKECG